MNMNLTSDNMMRKGIIGLGVCRLFMNAGEDNQHLFIPDLLLKMYYR